MMIHLGHRWFWILALLVTAAAYLCSRDADGQVLITGISFSFLSMAYIACVMFDKHIKTSSFLLHLVIIEILVIGALLVDPQLEEMGGMLNFIIPTLAAFMVAAGWVIFTMLTQVRRKLAASAAAETSASGQQKEA